jgi:hypothetical protein
MPKQDAVAIDAAGRSLSATRDVVPNLLFVIRKLPRAHKSSGIGLIYPGREDIEHRKDIGEKT